MRNTLVSFFPNQSTITQLSDVMINISTRVSLQRFKLNRKKSATKITHNKVEQMFVTKSFTVAHEIEVVVIDRPKADGIQLEPAYNGKFILRSPSSHAITTHNAPRGAEL